jgi:hypothetical protein
MSRCFGCGNHRAAASPFNHVAHVVDAAAQQVVGSNTPSIIQLKVTMGAVADKFVLFTQPG